MRLEPTKQQRQEIAEAECRLNSIRDDLRALNERLNGLHGDSYGLLEEWTRGRIDDAIQKIHMAQIILAGAQ